MIPTSDHSLHVEPWHLDRTAVAVHRQIEYVHNGGYVPVTTLQTQKSFVNIAQRIVYSCADQSGNRANSSRYIVTADTTPPTIVLTTGQGLELHQTMICGWGVPQNPETLCPAYDCDIHCDARHCYQKFASPSIGGQHVQQ